NLVERLQKHNSHVYSHAFTRKASDWEYAVSFECSNREKVQAIEFFVKKIKSRKFIVKIVENPHIIPDLPL
ncbi:GIY-YIG nuclease family protein, partial [Flavobacterium agri]|uniref:GIY-YIG nuclease family protein n=1 Tax=Flavobacterium agri TaxID=2743471 RepID=UPI001C37954F